MERQISISSTASSSSSPVASPMHRHARSGSTGAANLPRRHHNTAARAAAQRLARVMANQTAPGDDSDHDDLDLDLDLDPLATPRRRAARSPSPALGRYLAEQTPAVHPASAGRSTMAKPATLILPIKPLSKPVAVTQAAETPTVNRRDKRMSVDLGNLNIRETAHPHSSSTLQDEIDMLEEENENLLEKLRLAEERCKEVEARASQLEKQVATLGEGVSLEARLLSRKEAALQQREAALRAASQTSAKTEEIAALHLEAKTARNEAASMAEYLQETELEIKSLRMTTQNMLLTEEEMEEVVLKRCWLARHWKLCVHYGIHADIAETKHEYWSSLAPRPLEVVLSAGRKARDGCSSGDLVKDLPSDLGDLPGEGNIESMLVVEKGLHELDSLKVEDAVLLAMAQHRRANTKPFVSGPMLPTDGQNPIEAFELSQEESEDVLFKQACLTYFWRRVKDNGLEEDIADERLQFWINQSSHSPTSHDAVNVEHGLFELKKLGIESQLWEKTRKKAVQDSNHLLEEL